MIDSVPAELFRYLRVRGAAADAPADRVVIAPPAGLSYRLLEPLPDGRAGLGRARAPAAAAGAARGSAEPPSVDRLLVLGEALAAGDAGALDIARASGAADEARIAFLWDGLAAALLDPARHGEALRMANGLRAVWLCEGLQQEGRSEEDLLDAARSAVVHLQPLPEAPPPPPAPGPAPSPAEPTRPSAAERRASLAALERFVDEVQAAPVQMVQLPFAADAPEPAGWRPQPGFFSGRQASPPRPATFGAIRYDLSGLSPASAALARTFGGEQADPPTLIERARDEMARLSREMAADAPAGARIIVSAGITSVVPAGRRRTGWTGEIAEQVLQPRLPELASDWPTKCPVRVRGVAEFLRVEQTLVEYRAGELAHVENILQGEMKERLARSLTRSEQTIVEEAERVEESERESQTTTRFDMEKETEKALNAVAEAHGGVSASVSATSGYATVVVEGNLGFSSQTTKNEIEKTATKFSQSVTSRALDRIKTRTAQARTTRMLKEFEDTSRHVLDNRGGADHVVGAYRWIDQVYSARVMNYGARIAIEILIETPGAFLRPTQGGSDINLPEPPDGRHDLPPLNSAKDVSQTNYAYFAGLYGADVKPPPRDIVFISKAEVRTPDIYADAVHVGGEMEIPAGYVSVRFTARGDLVAPRYYTPITPSMRVLVANEETSFGAWSPGAATLTGCTGRVAYAIASWTRMYSMTITIECKLSREGLEAWQLETYQKIRDAYDELVRDARNQAAQEQARQGVAIQGRNPRMNEEIVRGELKKAAIWALCVGEQFWLDGEGTVVCAANGTTLPRLDSATCGRLKLASLLESAIDWKLMTFQLLPYYWANACDWQERLGYADPDPLYAEFLRAGAARIVVPLANGEAAALELLYFLNTGQRWTGSGPPPLLSDPDGLGAYLESIALETGPPTQVGDPWTVIVPTTLTVLECGSACVDGDEVAARLMPVGKKAKLEAGPPSHHE